MFFRVPNIHVAILFYIYVLGRFFLLLFFTLKTKNPSYIFFLFGKQISKKFIQTLRLFGTI